MKQTNEEQINKAYALLDELKEMRGGSVLDFHQRIANDPQLLNSFLQGYRSNMKGDNVIPPKYRELIIFAIGCARGADTTLQTHAKLAVEKGASIEEIGEVMRLILLLCGVTAVIPASKIFDKLVEE